MNGLPPVFSQCLSRSWRPFIDDRRSAVSLVGQLFSPSTMGRRRALDLTETVSAVTHLVISTEHLCRPGARAYGGLNNWAVGRDNVAARRPRLARLLDLVARPAVTTTLHAAKVAASLVLISPVRSARIRGAANVTIAGSTLVLYPRHHYGTDGSDQVSFLVQAIASLARAADRRSRVIDTCLWAVAAQSTLSYAASGWVKLAGPTWRGGIALEGITRTLTYGDPHVWRLVRRYPRTTRVLSTGVLVMECTFPVVYAAGGRLAKPYVASAALFHLANGRIMGLGRFIPAFLSMHPAVLYTTRPAHLTAEPGVPGRDDSFTTMLGAAAAGTALLAAATTWVNTRTLRAGYGDEQLLTTSDGNRLAYRVRGRGGPTDPVYVFENGMVSTTEHWEWTADRLGQQATVVTYHRAGYGQSTARPGTATELSDLVEHGRQLVEHVARGRRVVLVGHSLGGYLALHVAAACTDVCAVALVDSSHPDELELSEKQAAGQKRLTETFPVMGYSLDAGLGMLLKTPDFAERLPPATRAMVLAQYRTSRLWHAGRREWAATQRAFGVRGSLPPITVPVLVLSAQHTVEADEIQGDLHRAMADAAPWGEVHTLAGADHDSILSDRATAERVAEHLRSFVERSRDAATVSA